MLISPSIRLFLNYFDFFTSKVVVEYRTSTHWVNHKSTERKHLANSMDKLDPTLMSYLKGPYGAAGLPSISDVSLMQKALPGYGKIWHIYFDTVCVIYFLGDSLGYGNAQDTAGMASTYFNNFQLQQNKLPGMGLYGMPPFYGEFYGNNIYGN